MFSSTLLILLTALLLTLSNALTLNQFQPIVSFPADCTAAYNTPIAGCEAKDFSGGNPCSQTCIDSLQAISVKINAACVGTRADPTTLIGLFFQGRGVSTLCPNVVAVSAGAGSSSAGGNGIIGVSTLTPSSATSVASSIVAATSTSASDTTTTTASSRKASKTAAQTSTSPTRASSKADTTSKSTTKTSATLRGGFTTTAVNNGVASVITDKAEQTANPDGFGGGGSPFEVGVSGGLSLRISSALLLSVVVGMAMLLR